MPNISLVPKFIDGSDSKQSYMVFARKGSVVLAIKPLGFMDGKSMGVEGKTVVQCRIRSAGAKGLFTDEEAGETIQHLPVDFDLQKAWPLVSFDRADKSRASAILSAFIAGSLSTDPEKVLEKLDATGMIDKMAEAALKLADPEEVVVRQSTMTGWLSGKLNPVIADYKANLQAIAMFKKHADDTEGVFDFQGHVLKGFMLHTHKGHQKAEMAKVNEIIEKNDVAEPDFVPTKEVAGTVTSLLAKLGANMKGLQETQFPKVTEEDKASWDDGSDAAGSIIDFPEDDA